MQYWLHWEWENASSRWHKTWKNASSRWCIKATEFLVFSCPPHDVMYLFICSCLYSVTWYTPSFIHYPEMSVQEQWWTHFTQNQEVRRPCVCVCMCAHMYLNDSLCWSFEFKGQLFPLGTLSVRLAGGWRAQSPRWDAVHLSLHRFGLILVASSQ